VNRNCGIENFLNRKHERVTCFSTFSCEVPIVFPFYIEMATKSIIMNTPLACSWCMSGCYLVTGLTGVERATPFEVCGISTFETLILVSSIVMSIGCMMRVVQLSRCTRNGCGRDHNSNSLWFSDLLLKVRSRDCPDMTLNLVPNHHVPFVDFVGFLQQCHGLLSQFLDGVRMISMSHVQSVESL
jgi:hypothetical protein